MSGHRDPIAEGARREVRQGHHGDSDLDVCGTGEECGGRPTGEEQAAKNRKDDPPA